MSVEELQAHFQAYYHYYIVAVIVGGAVLGPPLYISRRISGPILGFLFKVFLCNVIVHMCLHVLVILASWFKGQTTMRYGNFNEDFNPGWTTPLVTVWDKETYFPTSLFYSELVLLLGVLLILWYSQPPVFPPKPKKTPKKKTAAQPGGPYQTEMTRQVDVTRKLEQSRRIRKK